MKTLRQLLYRGGLALLLVLGMGAAAAEGQRIVVYGATGAIGSVIVHEALSRGDTVVGVARDPSKLIIKDPHYTAVAGDVTDLDSFRRITAGADAVIIAVFANGRDNAPEHSVSARAARVAVEAYGDRSRSPHLIEIGSAHAMYPTRAATIAHLPASAPAGSPSYGLYVGHWLAYQTYRTSHLRWTVLTPPLVIQGWSRGVAPDPHRTGRYRVSTVGLVRDARGDSEINIADLAVAAVDEADHPRFIGRRFAVGY